MKRILKAMLSHWRIGAAVVALAAVVFFGRGLVAEHPSVAAPPEEEADIAEDADIVWTCSMHPEVQEPEPGDCPYCDMALIPREVDLTAELYPRRLSMEETARALAGIRVQPVRRMNVERTVRLFGQVDYDETRLRRVSADTEGRIERLMIDFTGARVRKGDHLFQIYSPRLISAQEELLQAVRTLRSIEDADEGGRRAASARSLAEAARQRLRWWGVTDEQIEEIETTRQVIDRLTIKSPIEGIVAERLVDQGDHVNAGQAVYRVADLSHVWVKLEAYESDLPWINYGQSLTFTAPDALPGRSFEGLISFVDPTLDRGRRTVRLRASVPNPRGELRPGMFLNAVLRSELTAEGTARKPTELAGKWVSPHHPEIVSDEPGNCPICGIELVRAEDLGFAPAGAEGADEPLVIPATAPLLTGRRAVVYVKVPDQERPTYEGREVVLGPRAGEHYLVRSGLEEGELVVARGAFKIDSELQIDARPSMMTPRAGVAPAVHDHGDHDHDPEPAHDDDHDHDHAEPDEEVADLPDAFLRRAWRVVAAAEEALRAAEGEDLETAQQAFADIEQAVAEVPADLLDERTVAVWNEHAMFLRNDGVEGRWTGSMRELRGVARSLRGHLGDLRGDFGLVGDPPAEDPLAPVEFRRQLAAVADAYMELQHALAHDELEATGEAVGRVEAALEGVDMALLDHEPHMAWMEHLGTMGSALESIRQAEDLETARVDFEPLSEALIAALRRFGLAGEKAAHVLHCPMAFDNRGADWLQWHDAVENPYFGAAMFACGEVRDIIYPAPEQTPEPHEHHEAPEN